MPATTITRAQVLAYRATAHDLCAPGTGAAVLATGLQDYPPGRSALLALALRTTAPPSGLALVHSVRGALHLHRAADLPVLRSALRTDHGREWAQQSLGPFGAELERARIGFGTALDRVVGAMRAVMADGVARTKGELSGAVSPQVDPEIAPWCAGCGVHHVHDLMFRLATLQAGLEVEVDLSVSSQFRFVRSPVVTEVVDGRPELVHRFLTTFGPARPAHLAAWLGHRPAAAREWWEPVADELAPVSVEGRKLWTHDVDALGTAEPPRGVRLLPAYDPLLELADRELLVAPADRRRTVWQAAANPGVLWVDGEVAGIWRQRRTGTRLVLTVEAFEELSPKRRAAAEPDAATIAEHAGLDGAELRVA